MVFTGKTLAVNLAAAVRPDHPRSRGEDAFGPDVAAADRGPPPLARGRLGGTNRRGSPRGTTPARAGKTPPVTARPPASGDHPRSRGEDAGAPLVKVRQGGPPPLARGRLVTDDRQPESPGTTPARAGKTPGRPRRRPATTDHPRSRGEDPYAWCVLPRPTGPPPLARGRRHRRRRVRVVPGTTPARAGKTSRRCGRPPTRTDHPRSRGEDVRSGSKKPITTGPPPLARGRRRLPAHQRRPRRTTPARAGKTSSRSGSAVRRWDHPRSRGEDENILGNPLLPAGPPPLARGRRPARTVSATPDGTTPARAGKTLTDLAFCVAYQRFSMGLTPLGSTALAPARVNRDRRHHRPGSSGGASFTASSQR